MQINYVRVEKLLPLADNPRTIDGKGRRRLRESLRAFGLFKPLLVWQNPDKEAVVIGGNQRLDVIKEMLGRGEKVPDTIPVVYFEGTEQEARMVAIRDNQSDGDWDWSMLPNYIEELDNLVDPEFDDLNLTGFDAATLSDLRALADAVETTPEEPSNKEEGDGSTRSHKRPEQTYVDHRFAMFTVGNLRGKVTMDVYGRWLQIFEAYSKFLDTTDVGVVINAMLKDWRKAR